MLPITDQLRVHLTDNPAGIDLLACAPELAVRLLERWPGAMIVYDQVTGDGRQGWLYLPDLRRPDRRPGGRWLAPGEAQPLFGYGDSEQDGAAAREQVPGHPLAEYQHTEDDGVCEPSLSPSPGASTVTAPAKPSNRPTTRLGVTRSFWPAAMAMLRVNSGRVAFSAPATCEGTCCSAHANSK